MIFSLNSNPFKVRLVDGSVLVLATVTTCIWPKADIVRRDFVKKTRWDNSRTRTLAKCNLLMNSGLSQRVVPPWSSRLVERGERRPARGFSRRRPRWCRRRRPWRRVWLPASRVVTLLKMLRQLWVNFWESRQGEFHFFMAIKDVYSADFVLC